MHTRCGHRKVYISPPTHTHTSATRVAHPLVFLERGNAWLPTNPFMVLLLFVCMPSAFLLSSYLTFLNGQVQLLGISRPLETDEWLEVSLAMKLGTETGSSHDGMRLLPSQHGAPRPAPLRAPWYHPRAVCVTLFPLGLDALKNVGDHVLLSCPEF